MITISDKADQVTAINIFTVESLEQQQQIVDFLVENKEIPMRQPGFISASVHTSLDGKRVINYVQWHSQKDMEVAMKDQDFIAMKEKVGNFAPHDFNFYQVVVTMEA
ncbi:antibiotic biosynthesis monooxygenase [Komarekiella sp. 'clone 1']|uniref:Antibiotic biosynthesis monooxygenase n=1 Tax=Komarekiella delphini-convector SJRDD-AB1 TaxID=2593771 RepID=A0AA40SV66_9NOST|nr:antibiotic biosynthesis monooxygenase [Komarekiella delphini-convector]MBD6615520.1 antibiotic biosynthesis monooxygenase [Komarekiella delphini-convector SJRDD-AB1]